jgi:hypothetical protein
MFVPTTYSSGREQTSDPPVLSSIVLDVRLYRRKLQSEAAVIKADPNFFVDKQGAHSWLRMMSINASHNSQICPHKPVEARLQDWNKYSSSSSLFTSGGLTLFTTRCSAECNWSHQEFQQTVRARRLLLVSNFPA